MRKAKHRRIIIFKEVGVLAEHPWGTWVGNGDGTHSRICTLDNSHVDKANCSGGEATCLDRAVCEHCGEQYGDLKPPNLLDNAAAQNYNHEKTKEDITMKISTEIGSASRIVGEHKAVELIAKAGFDAWDFSMFAMAQYDWDNHTVMENGHPLRSGDYLKFARELKKIGLDNGIVCNQSHAPFPADVKDIRDHFKRAIECTAEAGGEICIVHPDNYVGARENAEIYFELLPFAKSCGVKIAAENMWCWDWKEDHAIFAACATPESFNEHLDAVNDNYLTACLDIGHAEMKGLNTSAVEMIHALGKRLTALHLHDNDRWHDSHQIPFSMQIDFDAVVKALKEIDYQGYFTLEADSYLRAFNADTVSDGLRDMAKAARKLAAMFDAC